MIKEFVCKKEDVKKRLDIFLSEQLNLTRSQIKNYFYSITVNNIEKKLSYIVKENDIIKIEMKEVSTESESSPKPENITIDIVYEDKYIAVINKASGISVHCSKSETSGTLVNALLYHIKDFEFYGENLRAGIVHRLDKDTSGLIIIGKNPNIVSKLQEQFKNRTVKKIYHAISKGVVKEKNFIIKEPIARHKVYRKKMTVRPDGKQAITQAEVLRIFKYHTLLKINLKTGRTHQIRVHLSFKGYPVCGDKIYSKTAQKYEELMLLAKEIDFIHPVTNKVMHFEVDYPDFFKRLLYSDIL